MELRQPRIKKKAKFMPYTPLSKLTNKISSDFNGFSVIIDDLDDMKCIYERGFFGKANLSRSYPTFHHNSDIIRKRQYLKRSEVAKKSQSKKIKKVIVVPDSDTDDENYFVNLKPEYQIDKSDIKEKLCLSLVEAYYLANEIECLKVHEDDVILSKEDMWTKFSNTDDYFIPKFITYRHFREKGWVVKTGIKFGGDYLLYKDGPAYYHASYVVVIDVLNDDFTRKKDMQRRSMEIVNIIGLNRLCETAGKELLICQIVWPKIPVSSATDFSKITLNEVLVRRWVETHDN